MNSDFDNYEVFKPYDTVDTYTSLNRANPPLPTMSDYRKTPFVYLQGDREKFNDAIRIAERASKISNSSVGDIFFSSKNMKRIQKLIKDRFYERTKGEFRLDVDQDEQKLQIAMIYIYQEEARHLPDHIVRQVKELNRKLVDYILPDMITEVKQHYGYMRDRYEPLKPMMRPMNVSTAGTRSQGGFASVFNI